MRRARQASSRDDGRSRGQLVARGLHSNTMVSVPCCRRMKDNRHDRPNSRHHRLLQTWRLFQEALFSYRAPFVVRGGHLAPFPSPLGLVRAVGCAITIP